MTAAAVNPAELLLEPRQARRRRWASLLAATACAAHVAAASVLFGWYYWIVPRWKFELMNFGYEISKQATYLIYISDCVVNFWYLLVFVGPMTLIIDFIATRWIARQIGLRSASLVALCIVLLLLGTIAVGQLLLIEAKEHVLKQISIQGPSPTARSSEE